MVVLVVVVTILTALVVVVVVVVLAVEMIGAADVVVVAVVVVVVVASVVDVWMLMSMSAVTTAPAPRLRPNLYCSTSHLQCSEVSWSTGCVELAIELLNDFLIHWDA